MLPVRVKSLAAINREASDNLNVSAIKNEESSMLIEMIKESLSETRPRKKQKSYLAAAVDINTRQFVQENYSTGDSFQKLCIDEENNFVCTENEIIDFHPELVRVKQDAHFVDVESVEEHYFGNHFRSLPKQPENGSDADSLFFWEDSKENYNESNIFKIGSNPITKNFPSLPSDRGQMSCPYCQMKFGRSMRTEYSLHLRTHGESPLLCPVCPQVFKQQQNLAYHLKCQHLRISGKTVYQCESCEAQFSCSVTFAAHLRSLHCDSYFYRAMCKYCLSKLEQDRHLKHLLLLVHSNGVNTHMETSDNNKAGNLEEDLVTYKAEADRDEKTNKSKNYSFLKKTSQNNSMAEDPVTSSSYSCTRCPAEFVSQHSFENHQFTHYLKRTFQCPDCPAFYKSERDFYSHWRYHKGELAYHCDFCPSQFSQCCELMKHLRTVHFNKYWSLDEKFLPEFEENEKLEHWVDQNFEKSRDMISSLHANIEINSVCDASRYFCSDDSAGKPFYLCKFCSEQFHNHENLTSHLTAQHSNVYNDLVSSEENGEQRFRSTPHNYEDFTNIASIQNSRDQKDNSSCSLTHSDENSTNNALTPNGDIQGQQNFHSAALSYSKSGDYFSSPNFDVPSPTFCSVAKNYEDKNVLFINAIDQTQSVALTNVHPYQCPFCPTSFMNHLDLTKHFKTSHTDKLLPPSSKQQYILGKEGCSTTWDGISLTTPSDLIPSSAIKLEYISHTEEGLHPCQFCTAQYTRKNDLMRHFTEFHGVRLPSLILNFDSNDKSTVNMPHEFQDFPLNEELYFCEFCTAKFLDSSHLLKHLTGQHPDKYLDPELFMRGSERKKKQNSTGATTTFTDIKLRCPDCPAEFIWVNSMINHMKTHNAGKPL